MKFQSRRNLLSRRSAEEALIKACCSNDLEAVKESIKNGAQDLNQGAYISTSFGHIDLIRYFIQEGAGNYNEILDRACEYAQLDIVQLMISKGASISTDTLNYACKGGSLDILRMIINDIEENNIELEISEGFIEACCEGHIDIVKYLINNYNDVNHFLDIETGFDCACNRGQLELVKYLMCHNIYYHYYHVAKEMLQCDTEHYHIVKLMISGSDYNASSDFWYSCTYDSYEKYYQYLSEDFINRTKHLFLTKILSEELCKAIIN
jgi:ankyrin repeat protein